MSISNRAAKLTKAHRVLKKHYKPYSTTDRPVLEQLLYACCLQSAGHDSADEAFAKLQQAYYDWNEVRVTTVSELAEVMTALPRAGEAALRLKRTLQAIFESFYSFDIETLTKESIGKAVKQLKKLDGISDFAIAFVTQNGLSGHAIAVTEESLETLRVLGIISDDEAKKGRVPGLERAIPKSKGIEFGSLLHQLGADYCAAPFSPRVRAILVEIAPDAKDRLPKRATKKDGGTKRPTRKTKTKSGASAKNETRNDKKKTAMASKPKKKVNPAKKAPNDPKKKLATKQLSQKKPR